MDLSNKNEFIEMIRKHVLGKEYNNYVKPVQGVFGIIDRDGKRRNDLLFVKRDDKFVVEFDLQDPRVISLFLDLIKLDRFHINTCESHGHSGMYDGEIKLSVRD